MANNIIIPKEAIKPEYIAAVFEDLMAIDPNDLKSVSYVVRNLNPMELEMLNAIIQFIAYKIRNNRNQIKSGLSPEERADYNNQVKAMLVAKNRDFIR